MNQPTLNQPTLNQPTLNQPTLNQPTLARLGAACGAVFAIILTAANGDGSQSFSGPRAVAGIAALTLVVPFIAYLCSVLRAAEGPDGWLAATALAAGITGIALKLGSGAPELAMHRAHLAAGTPLRAAIDALGGGATVLSLYPLAVFCAAVAIVAFRTRILPRWLAAGAAVTAAALAVNGGFLGTSFVPALLLFALWTLLASVHLLRRTWRQPAPAAATGVAGAVARA
jgi:hypothetical protein